MRVDVGDVRLFVDVQGPEYVVHDGRMVRRPTVVLLHGGPGADCATTKLRHAYLGDVAQVVHYDHRGNGRSDDGDRSRWTLAQWGDDVVALCDRLGIEKPIVIGTSFGGMVAISYATRHPDHPAALGLVVTEPRNAPHEEIVEAFRRLGGDDVAELVRQDLAESTPETSERFLAEALPLMSQHPDAAEIMGRMAPLVVRRQEVELHFNNGESQTYDLRPGLARVSCPTLVLSGELDPICPPSCFSEIVEGLPAGLAEPHLLQGAGHAVALDAPDEVRRLLVEFVVRHAPEGTVPAPAHLAL